MANNPKRPQAYSPFLEFRLRRKLEGGDVLIPAVFEGAADAPFRRACLVLVHGFNNDDTEAAKAFFAYRNRQTRMSGAPPFTYDRYFGDAFWPGDADFSIFDFADAAIYPRSVKKAAPAGAQLFHLITRMPNLERVDFIAHSLGCRVVLEAVQWLLARPLPRIERIVLMAAAVPRELLQPGGRYHALMQQLRARGTKVLVMHSDKDSVLGGAFPIGQAAAGEPSKSALGRVGPDQTIPGYQGNLDGYKVLGATHGDYWGGGKPKNEKQNVDSTTTSGRFLGLWEGGRIGIVPRREVAPIEPVAARPIGTPRIPFARPL